MNTYVFKQNNSGGVYVGPRTIEVQAENAQEANEKAQEQGVYFDGVNMGIDCECCGDRWWRAFDIQS